MRKPSAPLFAVGVAAAIVAAIVASPIPMGANFPIFTGMGGMTGGAPISWEQLPGSSAKGIVLILRFHPM